MKKIIIVFTVLLGYFTAAAELRYVDGSFRSTSAADMQTTSSDIGKKNMTSEFADYAPQHDYGNLKSAIVRITFKNLSEEDFENKVAVSPIPGYLNKTEYKRNPVTNIMECWIHIDPKEVPIVLNINIDGVGGTKSPGLKIDKAGGMYALTVETDERIPVKFSSNVDGTVIWFNGVPLQGRTAPGVYVVNERASMGRHHIKAVAGARSKEFDIEVSKANNTFPIDLKPRYTVNFDSNEAGVSLYEEGSLLGTLPIAIEVVEGSHTYTVRKAGYDDKSYSIDVKGNATHRFDIHKNKALDFYALSNNTTCSGASVFIDNEYRGKTPLQLVLPYGRYKVRMSYNGRDKSDKLTVDDNTASRYMLKLPAHHRRFNPFDIDFHKREFGLSGGYVQKWLHLSDGVQSAGVDYFGEERHMNGFQVGVPVQPIFGYGLGINTGLYFEGYFADWTDPESYEEISMKELCLYMPVDFMFRLPLGEEFSIFVNGGIGIDWSLATTCSSEGYDDWDIDYGEDGSPNHFNFSGEFGGGIQFKALQVSGNYQIGLNNNSRMVLDGYTAKLRKFSVQLSIMF